MIGINPQDVKNGNRRALAKAITLIESTAVNHISPAQELLETLLPHSGNSLRLGISGSPGVGKSTFIEAFGQLILKKGHRLAILAVDPSSPLAGGSLLADKTRMQSLAHHPDVYIRPSPSAGALGGVANKTREVMLLCEAAGYDHIIVETVGVGQSEFQVADMVDFFAVLVSPNGGDEIQGIKKGIIEIADAVIVTKSDGSNVSAAEKTRLDYEQALSIVTQGEDWQAPVLTCSSTTNEGLSNIWSVLCRYLKIADQKQLVAVKRQRQNLKWLETMLHAIMADYFDSNQALSHSKAQLEQQVLKGEITPLRAAQQLVKWIKD